MHEIYWGAYELGEGGALVQHGVEQVCAPMDAVLPAGDGWFGAGDAWDVYGEVMRLRLGRRLAGWDAGRYPRARDIALLGVPTGWRGAIPGTGPARLSARQRRPAEAKTLSVRSIPIDVAGRGAA